MLCVRRMGVALVWVAVAAAPLAAGGPQVGNFCVQDFQGGATCTANDVRFEAFDVVQVIEECNEGVPGEAEIVLQATVSASGSPDRFDIGMFIALDGASALDGDNCLHDYLQPPLTGKPVYGDVNGNGVPEIVDGPWWDGGTDADQCGDMETNTEVIKTLVAVRIACVDTNGDGSVDVSACASWDNNTASVCNDVADAFPGTPSKCSCTTIETGAVVPVELLQFEVE